MQAVRVVIYLEELHQNFFCFLECEMPDIRHLTFEGPPEAFYRLIVAGGPGTGHAFPKSVPLHQFLRLPGCVLRAAVAVEYRVFRAIRIPPDRHQERCVHNFLPLMSPNRPTDQSSGGHIDDSANIHLAFLTHQNRDV